MTREQLDAIRARVEAAPKVGDTFIDENGDEVRIVETFEDKDVPALLAEVERLTAERDAAFQRGVAAMREAAVLASRENIGCRHMVCHSCESPAAVIRALPDPEDTP